MLFNSFQFLLFFPIVTIIYFLLPHKLRWLYLLISSCIFYISFIPVYIFILFFTIIIDYVAAIMIENKQGRKRKIFLILSIIANVGVLAVFKYYNFFIDNINTLFNDINIKTYSFPLLNIILPIGLSFHTFQAMSYTIEVYRGKQKAEKHFGIYALYVMFWPQLVAGPIERPQNMLHQFYTRHSFNNEHIAKGLRLMLWGFFLKVVIADRLALYVDAVYNNVGEHNGTTLLLATLFFAFQIYCDFAGYSYIAIGSAQVMGFNLMTNFNHPYFSKSIAEFWQRWHISLSTWFRDYLYIPLGGNRVSIQRWYFNLFFVFLISGLWHGANWTFIIWGGSNGLYLVFALITNKWWNAVNRRIGITRYQRIYNVIRILTTFVLIDFAWIFFRANTISDAFIIIKKIFSARGTLFTFSDPALIPYSIFGILSLLIVECKREYFRDKYLFLSSKNIYIRPVLYFCCRCYFIISCF